MGFYSDNIIGQNGEYNIYNYLLIAFIVISIILFIVVKNIKGGN